MVLNLVMCLLVLSDSEHPDCPPLAFSSSAHSDASGKSDPDPTCLQARGFSIPLSSFQIGIQNYSTTTSCQSHPNQTRSDYGKLFVVLVIIGSICAIIIVLGLIYNCWQRRLPKMKNVVSECWTGEEGGWTLVPQDGWDWKAKREIVFH